MSFPRWCTLLRQGRFQAFLNNTHFTRTIYCVSQIRPLETKFLNTNIRLVSTYEVNDVKDGGVIKKILRKIPFFNVERVKIKAAAYLLYENIADKINYIELFEKYDLPDTFYSWFVLTELHLWILSARAMAEGDEGKLIRNCLLEAFWSDVAQRVKKLGAANPSATRTQVKELSEQLQASLIAYDEGLQSDDFVLAGALWRRLYQMEYAPPQHLEELVRYIRKHVAILDHLTKEQILSVKPVRWESI